MRRYGLIAAVSGAVVAVALSAGVGTDVRAAGPLAQFAMSPNPIAAAGTLAAGASVTVTVTAEDSTGAAVAGADIFLRFKSVGGTASVGTMPLGVVPQGFLADASGQVTVTYTAAPVRPPSGRDVITAQDTASTPTISTTDVYSYSGIKRYTLKPKPIAATGTLAAGAQVTVTLTALSTSGSVARRSIVYLSFVPATGGGSASVAGHVLTSTPSPFRTSSAGTLRIVYTAPATPPTAGTDTLTAQNGRADSTAVAMDSYTF